jgi:hypothetical protein
VSCARIGPRNRKSRPKGRLKNLYSVISHSSDYNILTLSLFATNAKGSPPASSAIFRKVRIPSSVSLRRLEVTCEGGAFLVA